MGEPDGEPTGRPDAVLPPRHVALGSRSATLLCVTTIPQKELRNNVSDVLRRAEGGEQFTITVAGRPVAELGPVAKRRWVGAPTLREIVRTPAPRGLLDDLKQLPGQLEDPFE
jgi:prevent-host-death family protein